MKTLLVILALCASSIGQTAKVIQLSPEDAAIAKSLYEASEKAQQAEADFRKALAKKYLTLTTKPDGSRSSCSELMRDDSVTRFYASPHDPAYVFSKWGDGIGCGSFEYSEDYKFIVPIRTVPFTLSRGIFDNCIAATGALTQ